MARPITDIFSLRASDFLATHLKQAIKSHIDWDVSGRMVTHYTADADAQGGEPCLRTDYQYDGTSGRVTGQKETVGAWDGTWDF